LIQKDFQYFTGCFLNYLDVVFVVDSSNSISPADFEKMRTVMLDAVGSFSGIGETMQIAILQYGDASIRRYVLRKNYSRTYVRAHYRRRRYL